MMIVNPVIVEPLTAEWQQVWDRMNECTDEVDSAESAIAKIRAEGAALFKADHTKAKAGEKERQREITALRGRITRARTKAQELHESFLERLHTFRILDPACGSGNFLYLSLLALKDLEHRANLEAEALGLKRRPPRVGPEAVRGIEINRYAAELARVSIWIGEIQWMRRNGFDAGRNPILRPLGSIECRDALLEHDPETNKWSKADWPNSDVIIGNPPFLGSRKIVPELGKEYTATLRRLYKESVPKGADLVCFWFARTGCLIQSLAADRVGLVATNSIAGGASRRVLDEISACARIYRAWRDEPWTVEGAAVRVALICFGRKAETLPAMLDGQDCPEITADLRSIAFHGQIDVASITKLTPNSEISFQGIVPRSSVNKATAERLGLPEASFVVIGDVGREMLAAPTNPNGMTNERVVFPYLIAQDITQRPKDRFIVDFNELDENEAALFEMPFGVIAPVREHRAAMSQPEALTFWWKHWRSRPEMRAAISDLSRFIATPRVAKHRVFVWVNPPSIADNAVVVMARDDDTTFGILHSKFHELWSLRMCTWLGVGNDPRYTPNNLL